MEIKEKKKNSQPIIFILEGAPLKIATIGKDIVLLNCDDHKKFINRKLGKDPYFFRPDVVHRVG